ELFEAITWGQLGLHEKPIGLLDVDAYFAPLIAFIEHMNAEGFVRPPLRLVRARTARELLDQLLAAPPATVSPPGPHPRPRAAVSARPAPLRRPRSAPVPP